LQCVAACYSVLQRVAACCTLHEKKQDYVTVCRCVWKSVLQHVAVCCGMLQCGASFCGVLHRVAVSCSELKCGTPVEGHTYFLHLHHTLSFSLTHCLPLTISLSLSLFLSLSLYVYACVPCVWDGCNALPYSLTLLMQYTAVCPHTDDAIHYIMKVWLWDGYD